MVPRDTKRDNFINVYVRDTTCDTMSPRTFVKRARAYRPISDAQKRKIQKNWFITTNVTPPTTLAGSDLVASGHEDYTFLGFRGSLSLANLPAADGQVVVAVMYSPNGSLGTTTLLSLKDGYVADNLLWSAVYEAGAISENNYNVPIDIKSKRKLGKDDKIEILSQGSVANVARFSFAGITFLLKP